MSLPRACYVAAAILASVGLASAAATQANESPLHAALGASDELTITASVRPRIKAIDGQFRPDAARSDTLLSIQTTLAVDYHPGRFFTGSEVWDVRG